MILSSLFEAHTYRLPEQKYRALFEVSAATCGFVWGKIEESIPTGGLPVHLLWIYFFLEVYGTEGVHSTLAGVDPKVFRKWIWEFIPLIANVLVVRILFLF